MKKTKRHAAKSSKKVQRRSISRRENTVFGVDYEFIFIAGGGFLVITLGVLLFFSN